MLLKQQRKEFLRFCAVGVMNTLVDMGVFGALVQAGLWVMLAHMLSFSCSALNSYFINKYWTFARRGRPQGREFLSFMLVTVVGLFISSLVLFLLKGAWGVYPAKMASVMASMLWNYLGARRVFQKR